MAFLAPQRRPSAAISTKHLKCIEDDEAYMKPPRRRLNSAHDTIDMQEVFLTANTPGLMNGGLAGLFWSLIWTSIGQFFVVLSLAEIASMAPTAGGQSHWVSEWAPKRSQRFLSYCTGWTTSIAWQSIVATDCYIIAGIIQALMVVNDPAYSSTRWAGTLLTIVAVMMVSAFNTFAASHLPIAEGIFATCRVFAFVPIVVTLWVIVSPKTPAPEVFVNFGDHTGTWPSTGLSVLVGQTTALFVSLGSDAVAHLCEEVQEAAIVVPEGMMWSYLLVRSPLKKLF
ncbi:hypothetical protein LTR37_012131 [Vermiconidia calcicola]|uniref:Uncharacterized protein n=1 Tax=Vermiconidia calcicola TaxID=1690605 RepID=A0ACC3N0D2_9PEZI|nr:hypothetical protein LTR37_012131 [Vermiconidia calcicola]